MALVTRTALRGELEQFLRADLLPAFVKAAAQAQVPRDDSALERRISEAVEKVVRAELENLKQLVEARPVSPPALPVFNRANSALSVLEGIPKDEEPTQKAARQKWFKKRMKACTPSFDEDDFDGEDDYAPPMAHRRSVRRDTRKRTLEKDEAKKLMSGMRRSRGGTEDEGSPESTVPQLRHLHLDFTSSADPAEEEDLLPQQPLFRNSSGWMHASKLARPGSLYEDGEDEEVMWLHLEDDDSDLTVREQLQTAVEHIYFEYVCAIVILLNTITLGVETEYHARFHKAEMPWVLVKMESIFCILFTVELCTRLFVYRVDFFCGNTRGWNLFDMLVVGLQLSEQVLDTLRSTTNHKFSLSYLRILRLLRLIRITRLFRVIKVVEELRTIVHSVVSSLRTSFWTVLFQAMLMYLFSVLFTEAVNNMGDPPNAAILRYWFGSLGRTYLTAFECISGGITWDEVVMALISDIHPVYGLIFCCYIFTAIFCIMNVITGIFVEKATSTAQEHTDHYMTSRISEIFLNRYGRDAKVSFEQFADTMDTNEMRDYFKAINVDPSEAGELFDLLDTDRSGSVDADEIISGCLRLRGNAKALELGLLLHQIRLMQEQMDCHNLHLEQIVLALCRTLGLLSQGPGPDGEGEASKCAEEKSLKESVVTTLRASIEGVVSMPENERQSLRRSPLFREPEREPQEDGPDGQELLRRQRLVEFFRERTDAIREVSLNIQRHFTCPGVRGGAAAEP